MPRKSIPAPGFQTITGTRAPPKKLGDRLLCQIRHMGWCDPEPWPVEGTRWIWVRDEAGNIIEHPGDIVAIKIP